MSVDASGLFGDAEKLMYLLLSVSTGGSRDDDTNREYRRLRQRLTAAAVARRHLPRCVQSCRDISAFWQFIGTEFGQYDPRRKYLREQFEPLLATLESGAASPSDESVSVALSRIDSEHVQRAWQVALERRATDPEGAITASRSVLEAVCKHILDEEGVDYGGGSSELPKLYGLAAERLNLAPSQHSEQLFKRILGGCHTVVDGLAAIRNQYGDAHGPGKARVRPESRHAELAVNLAGTVASFLIATWEARKMSARN